MAENRHVKQALLTVRGKSYPLERYTFDFFVQFRSEIEPAVSRIRLYNIPLSDEQNLKIGTALTLEAGSGTKAVILDGVIVGIKGKIENNNKITIIDVKNSTLDFLKPISKSFGAIKSSVALNNILKSSNMEVKTIAIENDLILSEELQTIDETKLYTAVKHIVEYAESKAVCHNDEIAIRKPNTYANTGITISDSDLTAPVMAENRTIDVSGMKYNNNFKVITKLNYNYKPDSTITLNTSLISGNFVILEGLHRGGKKRDFSSEIIISLID